MIWKLLILHLNLKIIKGSISNIRFDSLIATAFGDIQKLTLYLLESGKVFVNGKRWLHLTDTNQNLMILFPLGERQIYF